MASAEKEKAASNSARLQQLRRQQVELKEWANRKENAKRCKTLGQLPGDRPTRPRISTSRAADINNLSKRRPEHRRADKAQLDRRVHRAHRLVKAAASTKLRA